MKDYRISFGGTEIGLLECNSRQGEYVNRSREYDNRLEEYKKRRIIQKRNAT